MNKPIVVACLLFIAHFFAGCTLFQDSPIEVVQKTTVPKDTYFTLRLQTHNKSFVPFVSRGPSDVAKVFSATCMDARVCRATIETERTLRGDLIVVEPLATGVTEISAEVLHPVSEQRQTIRSIVEVVDFNRPRLTLGMPFEAKDIHSSVSDGFVFNDSWTELGGPLRCAKDEAYRRNFNRAGAVVLSEWKCIILTCRSPDRRINDQYLTLDFRSGFAPSSIEDSKTLVCLSVQDKRLQGVTVYRSSSLMDRYGLPIFEKVKTLGMSEDTQCP